MMPKPSLRQSMLARRCSLEDVEREAAAWRAQQALLASAEFASARVVALYAAVQNEVETVAIFSAALGDGKTVVFPAVTARGMEFRQVTCPDQFERGTFGIPTPGSTCTTVPVISLDLVVIPAVAFTLSGQRIGYGKGYYDRTVHSLEGSGRLAGLCYDFQVVEPIPDEPHDVRMDFIVTDQRVIRPSLTYEEVLRQ